MVVHDEAGVPTLYVHVPDTTINGMDTGSFVYRWNGQAFEPAPLGTLAVIGDMCDFDDGNGNKLYVGGSFSLSGSQGPGKDLAVLNGSAWQPVGQGLFSTQLSFPHVLSMTVHDEGAGPELVLGGYLTMAGGQPVSYLARWDGQNYSSIGDANGFVKAVASVDFGSGPELFVQGGFTLIGGLNVPGFARLGAAGWSAPGVVPGGTVDVGQMLPVDLGSGPELLVAGGFAPQFNSVMRFNGTTWSSLGHGLTAKILDLAVIDFGSGPEVYAASVDRLYRFAAGGWTEVAQVGGPVILSGGGQINDLEVADLGHGKRLLISGAFDSLGGVHGPGLLAFDGSQFEPLSFGFGGAVKSLLVDNNGPQPSLIVGGVFKGGAGLPLNRIARYQGGQWSPLGAGFDFGVRSLGSFDLGSGPELYAGGIFTQSGSQPVNGVARFDGTFWQPLGLGLQIFVFASGNALSMATYDSGSGPQLYVGGQFTRAGGIAAEGIARWSGVQWSPVGTGTDDANPLLPVTALAVHDDGQGARLFAGGSFVLMGGVTANHIAAWDGSAWSALGGGVDGNVEALIEFDDGGGPALFVGGQFTSAGGLGAANIARWRAGAWSPVAGGLPGQAGVRALVIHDEGQGQRLYAAVAGAPGLWRLDPSGWQALDSGSTAAANCLVSMPSGALKGLLMGTQTPQPNLAGDSFLARYSCPNFVSWSGCSAAGAVLTSSANQAPLGQTLPLSVSAAGVVQGLAALYAGALGLDGSGCGLTISPGVELLLALAPAPLSLGVVGLQAGSANLSVAVPANPSLAGKTVALQALVAGPGPALGFELSNALELLLGP